MITKTTYSSHIYYEDIDAIDFLNDMQIKIRDYKHQQKLVKICYIFKISKEVKPHPFSHLKKTSTQSKDTYLSFCSALEY